MIRLKTLPLFIIFSQVLIHSVYAQNDLNGVWAYDAVYNSNGKRIGISPGLYANQIINFNATTNNKIAQVYSYGGNLKMYCEGSGGSSPSTPCNDSNMTVSHQTSSTIAYYTIISKVDPKIAIEPIVDGIVGGDFLKTFDSLDEKTAQLYADKVAQLYCSNDAVSGVEFDLEPFNINANGEYAFYMEIAKDFAGKHNPYGLDPYGCVNSSHPTGRTFSVFATGAKVNERLGKVLNAYQNGSVIGPLYSLIKYTGVATPPPVYRKYIDNEIKRMVRNANQFGVKFQFGIPASSTIEEFEFINDQASGYQQLDYVKEAIASINLYARNEPNFLGIDLWAFSARRIKSTGVEFKPSSPPQNVLNYLANYLMKGKKS